MKTRAAVLHGQNEQFKVQEVDLDPPGPHEVRVRLAATGLCHSDYHLVTGDLPMPYPVIGGHEGAGVIEEVGAEVTAVEPGDHVVLSFIPACGHCRSCAVGHSNLCDLGANILAGPQLDGTYRFHVGAQGAGQMCLLGTFAEHTVVPDVSVVKIDRSVPLRTAALIGCGVPTGYGAAVNKAKVRPGESVVVWGAGGIGMNAIQGAATSGARVVVAVEPDEAKRKLAYEVFGATHVVDPTAVDPVDAVLEATWNRGADVSIATPGVLTQAILAQALQALGKGGRAVLVAVPPAGADHLPIAPFDVVMFERQILGTVYGSSNPFSDIPQLIHLYQSGKLKLDELVTNTYSLDQINEGYEAMLAGRNIRGLVILSDD